MKQKISPYVLSFQSERFYRGWRYHWMICAAWNPDELVSWGHAPTQELAETVARNEVEKLVAGLTEGGRLSGTSKSSDIPNIKTTRGGQNCRKTHNRLPALD